MRWSHNIIDTHIYDYERDWYECDREAAMAMRELCDYESKESETTVSRKTLHVPEVAEDDKDLEY